jgi:hypothetical protein
MTPPSPAAVRMRRTRERRRQGDVIVSVEVGPKVTADLVELDWLPAHDCGDKDTLTRALTELVERAIEVRVTRALGSQGKVCFLLRNPAQHNRDADRAWLAPRRSAGRPSRNCDGLPPFRRPIARHCA